jgi:acetoin utilization deacetylase AcuC-like enzyme
MGEVMKVFYDPVQKAHVLSHEIIAGKRFRHHERRARIDIIRRHLRAHGQFEFVVPEPLPMEAVLAVHDEAYIRFLESSQMLSKDEVIWPYVFPCDRRVPIYEPVTVFTAGYYCFDVGTPIMSDTWQAAIAAASGAYAAAQHLKKTGEVCYALARPPGHHAASALFGGYCYLNNAAIAAQYLSQYGKILLIDFDYHHGNGTQSIFYDNCEVYYLSLHGNPAIEYPYFTGYEHEIGIDDGEGFNLNCPLEPHCGPEEYFSAFKRSLEAALKRVNPKYIVCSCGFDVADKDPLGHFGLQPENFHELGRHIRSLNKPTLLVQEGGYLVERLGLNVEAFLTAFL